MYGDMKMNHSILKSKNDTLVFLGLNSPEALKTLHKDPTFPKAVKLGNTRQAPVFFDTQELIDWVESKKAQRPETPTYFGKIEAQGECAA